MDYEQLKQYQQSLLDRALNEGIRRNVEQTETWLQYKTRHEKVIESLEMFSRELNVDCMVPIGKKALMRGKLTHTNEILVSLGQGYFVEYSASQAVALCHRRIKRANDILESLGKERNLYETRKSIPECFDAFGTEHRKDLIEHWDEEKLDDWRVQHRQREKEYRKKLAEFKNAEKQDIKTEDDLFAKLDALELQEELEDELYRLEAECPDFYTQDYEGDEIDEESDETEDEDLPEANKDKIDRSEILSAVGESSEDKSENQNSDSPSEKSRDSTVEKTSDTRKKRVVFAESHLKYGDEDGCVASGKKQDEISDIASAIDSDDDDIVRINFKHSDFSPEILDSSDKESFTSPRDIYELVTKPKSILKNSSPSPIRVTDNLPTDDDSCGDEMDDSFSGISAYNTVVKDVQETKIDNSLANSVQHTEEKRPVSKFKRDRANMKR